MRPLGSRYGTTDTWWYYMLQIHYQLQLVKKEKAMGAGDDRAGFKDQLCKAGS